MINRRVARTARLLAAAIALLAAAGRVAAQGGESPFPRTSPEAVGLSSEKLRTAMDSLNAWVGRDRVMGGVLLVIRHGRIAFHEAAGWSDRERDIPLRTDHVVSMRSMTKPLVGMAALMLIEEGKLRLEDRVADHLPSFDNEHSRDITVFQLLTHTSGLTGEIYNDQNGTGTPFGTLREAVDAVGARGPTLEPGTRYSYSDPGTSTLGAVIAEVAGMPAEAFLQHRILDPLGMNDSRLVLPLDDPIRSRVAATYRRAGDGWERYWDNTRPEAVPFFRASGGLWSTSLDYARFMTMMLQHGRSDGQRLLDSASIARAVQPHAEYAYPPEERAERDSFYGLHWTVLTDRYRPVDAPFSAGTFLHAGSDGTVAWADPARGLLVIYLTQSRGHDTSRPMLRLVYDALGAEAVSSPARAIALTFDDLPAVSVTRNDLEHQRRITDGIVGVLSAQRVPAIGFVNENKLERNGTLDTTRIALLRRWLDAGLELGNHTFSHPDLHRIPPHDFHADVLRGERVTRALLGERGRQPRFFRHPFLHTGRTTAVRDSLEAFLTDHGYRVAPVTIDNYDYVFANAWDRAHLAGDTVAADRIADAYLTYMDTVAGFYEAQARAIVGREIPQVLLLHASALNAATLDALLDRLRRRGYRFITLDEALSDEAYRLPDAYAGPAGITWLHRWAITARLERGIFAGEPVVPDWVAQLAR